MRPPMNRQRRKRAEMLMTDRCVCKRPGHKVTLPNGDDSFTEETTVYAGRCKVQSYRPYESVINSAGRPSVVQRLEVHVPIGSGPFEIGDVFHIEGRPRPLRVGGLDEKTEGNQSAQRLLVDQQSNRGGQ